MEIEKCRACLQTDMGKHNILTEFYQGINLQEMLMDTTGLQVIEGDGLSPFLCSKCTNIVVDFYIFRQTFEENENHQRRALLMSSCEIKNDCTLEESVKTVDDLALCEEIKNDFNKVLEDYTMIKLEIYSDSDEETVDGSNETFQNQDLKCENVDFAKSEAATQKKIVKNASNRKCCPVCNETFDSHKDLRAHMRCHKLNVCHICGSELGTKWDLTEHLKGHFEERSHVCDICDRGFKRKKYLVKHRKTHTNPRDKVCELCGKAFNDKSTLNTHVRLIHVRHRNLVCPICNRKFSLKATLDKHILRHQNRQREFHCKMCSSGFRDKSSLERHVLVRHSGTFVKPKCDICGKSFSCTGILTRHKRNVHKEVKLTSDVTSSVSQTQVSE